MERIFYKYLFFLHSNMPKYFQLVVQKFILISHILKLKISPQCFEHIDQTKATREKHNGGRYGQAAQESHVPLEEAHVNWQTSLLKYDFTSFCAVNIQLLATIGPWIDATRIGHIVNIRSQILLILLSVLIVYGPRRIQMIEIRLPIVIVVYTAAVESVLNP